MAGKNADTGLEMAKKFYDGLDGVDAIFEEILAILRKPEASAADMKRAEQFKNTARVRIAQNSLRCSVLTGLDGIARSFGRMGGAEAPPPAGGGKRRRSG